MQDNQTYKGERIKSLIETPVYDEDLMNQYKWAIAQNIYAEMDKKNLTAHQLAAIIGIHYTHLYNIVRGESKIGLDTLIKVAFGLGCKPSVFFPEEMKAPRTDGDRFNAIVRDMDVQSKNYLLDLCNNYSKEWRRLRNKSKIPDSLDDI